MSAIKTEPSVAASSPAPAATVVSIGISIVISMLSHTTQIVRSGMVEDVTPGRGAIETLLPGLFDPGHEQMLGVIDQEIGRQGAMIGYLNDFHFMMFVVLAAVPLLLFMRSPRNGAPRIAQGAATE